MMRRLKRQRIFYTTLLLLLTCSGGIFSQITCEHNNRSVFFGERSQKMTAAERNVIQVFLDKEGMYYPDYFIADNELEANCSSLRNWYKANPTQLNTICKQYAIPDTQDEDVKIELLNVAIAERYLQKINGTANTSDCITILIHGFRKRAYGEIDSHSSYSCNDYKSLRTGLSKNKGDNILFVEIYWDGKFITPRQCYRYKGFNLFEHAAMPNADRVGLSLRQIVSKIKNDNLHIVSHSLGARVAGEMLFNSNRVELAEEKVFATPAQKNIKVCLIAPALGFDYFNTFYSRNTTVDFKEKDNYKLGIVYNTNDFVLLKHYGFGVNASPIEYGNTSLGCDYNSDINKLANLFKTKFRASAEPVQMDFSNSNNAPMHCHHLICYVNHSDFQKISNFLNH